MKVGYLTSRNGTLLNMLQNDKYLNSNISFDVYSNNKSEKLEAVAKNDVHYFKKENELLELLDKYNPDIILSAGYGRILTDAFVSKYGDKSINIHPGLRAGKDPQIEVLKSNDSWTGNLLHYISNDLDAGELIAKSQIRVYKDDTYKTLNNRLRANSLPMIVDFLNNYEHEFK